MQTENDSLGNSYDELPYPGQAVAETHPDNLHLRAGLAGFTAAAVPGCRVLEIGCAGGANLLPMTDTIPDGSFVGIDLSAVQIERGNRVVGRAGITSVELKVCDVVDFAATADVGKFDYVLIHGVYSWVPAAVRGAILELCSNCLTDRGLAYISYNVLPGWRLKQTLRDAMLWGARKGTTAAEKIRLARAQLALSAADSPGFDVYKTVIQRQCKTAIPRPDWYLSHEYLARNNEPFFYEEFAESVVPFGLRCLTDASLSQDLSPWMAPVLVEQLKQAAQTPVEFEQQMDFLTGRTFRQTILSRASAALDKAADDVSALFAAGQFVEETVAEGIKFSDPRTGRSSTARDPGVVAAFRSLSAAWPAFVPVAGIIRTATHAAAALSDAAACHHLFAAYRAGLISLRSRPADFLAARTTRPTASALARAQLAEGEPVSDLRHTPVALDEMSRQILPLLDGSRNPSRLAKDICGLIAAGHLSSAALAHFGSWSAKQAGDIDAVIHLFANLGLLLDRRA